MMRCILFSLLLPCLLFSQYIPKYKAGVEPWLLNCLVKDSAVRSYYKIDPYTGISIYASPEDKAKDKPELHVPPSAYKDLKACFTYQPFDSCWKFYSSGKYILPPSTKYPPLSLPFDSLRPLTGFRIAIDPGHIAGDYSTAKLERKSVQIKKDSLNGIMENDTIIEGKLTYYTAMLLKKKLEAAGAIVLITREKENYSAFGKDFDTWMKEDFKRCLDSAVSQGHITAREKTIYTTKAKRKVIFRDFFLQEDLRERARKINRFNPDITLVIHYNVDEKNEGWTKPTNKNFNMVFIPGAFMAGAMQKKEGRFNFLRLLLTDDLLASSQLAAILGEQLSLKLNVPLADEKDAAYLTENCNKGPGKGVYCRNLALTRLILGPIAYGESLYQDNTNEYKALSLHNFKDGKVPKRIEEVADAYFQAVTLYFR